MSLHRHWAAAAVALFVASASQAQVTQFVPATSAAPTAIGNVTVGQQYTITVTGVADLYANFNGGQGLPFTADGLPTYAFPSPYSAFFPSGLDYDPSQGPGAYGLGGPGMLVGALLGTFSAAPSGPSSFFSVGLGGVFSPSVTGTLYGLINDVNNGYGDNASGFTVTLSPVPEPGSCLLMVAGVGALLAQRRRRQPVA